MKLNVNEIIVLENHERYITLEKIEYEKRIYFLVMGILENNEILAEKVEFIYLENSEEESFIIKVKDKKLIKILTEQLKNK